MDSTRRHWLLGSLSSFSLSAIAAARGHAHQAVTEKIPRLDFFTPETAADISALASQIIPSAGGPGATEAGAVYFIDRALTTFESEKQDAYRTGLREINETRQKLFPESASIASLAPDQQLALVHAIEKSDFFELLRIHTVLGFLGDPSYGGNRDKAGWKHIGFDDSMAFTPPFGYYDAGAQ